MEYGLRLLSNNSIFALRLVNVLILVLMEYGLRLIKRC